MTATTAHIHAAVTLLLLASATGTATAQARPGTGARPAPTVAPAADPARRAADAHLARAPKRKPGLAMRVGKDQRARTDTASTPAGRPPTPRRARGVAPKGTGR